VRSGTEKKKGKGLLKEKNASVKKRNAGTQDLKRREERFIDPSIIGGITVIDVTGLPNL